jgi:hypothetical protein
MTPDPNDPEPSVRAPHALPTPAQVQAGKDALLRRMRGQRLWPAGKTFKCPGCGNRTLKGSDDVHVEVVRDNMVHAFRHMHGAMCSSCPVIVLEPYDAIGVEDQVGMPFVSDYEAKVTNIGTGTVGTYWPKDVQRIMGLRKGRRMQVQLVDQDTMLIRVK